MGRLVIRDTLGINAGISDSNQYSKYIEGGFSHYSMRFLNMCPSHILAFCVSLKAINSSKKQIRINYVVDLDHLIITM